MIVASLPLHFWTEAISTSTYLINIQPSAALQGGIPLEHLSDRSPDYSMLRLFGCVCSVLLAPVNAPNLLLSLSSVYFSATVMSIRVIGVGIMLLVGCVFHGV